MSLLVYCSYPVLDQNREPDWVPQLEDELLKSGISTFQLYRPWIPLKEQSRIFPLLESQPHPFFEAHADTVRVQKEVLGGFYEDPTQKLLSLSDRQEPNNVLPFKDMYCIVRSHIVVADLSTPSFGEVFRDIFYANLAGIPIIGLSDKFLISPVMMERIDTLVPSTKIDVVVRQLVGYSLGYIRDSGSKTGDLSGNSDSPGTETLENGKQDTAP